MKNSKYKEVNGLFFKEETPQEVCNIISSAYHSRRNQRLKLYFGDTATGRDWTEEYDTIGYIGRSTGSIKIPLLIRQKGSYGGGAILDHCILKIKDVSTGRVLYQHEKYVAPKIEIVKGDLPEYPFNTIVNGAIHGRHKTERSAQMLRNKLV